METETTTANVEEETQINWFGGILSGLAAGIVFGIIMQMMMTPVITEMIPALYGFGSGLALGWSIHLLHSAVFGLVYVALTSVNSISRYANALPAGIGLGLVYGLVVWITAASIVMPVWIGVVTPMTPPVPDFNPMSAIGHAVFGAVLGGLYSVIRNR